MLSYLVIGGAGFFGSHVVKELLFRGTLPSSIAIFDLEAVPETERFNGVYYIIGNITDEIELKEAFALVCRSRRSMLS